MVDINHFSPTADKIREAYDVRVVGADDGNRLDWFLKTAFSEAVKIVADNSQNVLADTDPLEREEVVGSGPLRPDNVRDIKVRNRELADPKVTVWLNDCPTFANTASTRTLVDIHGNDCHAVLDVREF